MDLPPPVPELLETLLHGSDEAVLIVDGTSNILFSNTRVVELWGYRQRELLNKKLSLLLSFESRAPKAGEDGARGRRLEAYRRDGSSFPVEVRWLPMASGGRSLSLVLVRDVQTLEAARDRVRQLDKALVTMRVGVAITDRDQRLLYLNPALAEMHGYEPGELLGERLSVFAPTDPAARFEFRELKQQKKLRHEGTHLRRDGSELPVEVMWDLFTDSQGEPVGIVMICQDIRERREAEQALRSSEERYALAVRGANDGIWDWNLASERIFFSTRWKRMLGFEDVEIGDEPREWLDRVHPEDRPQLERGIAEHLEGRTPWFENEHRMQHRDGSYRWILARGLAVLDSSGQPSRMAGSQTDITELKVHDPLTGLPNRALFLDRLALAMGRVQRRDAGPLAALFLDLDRFKVINDSLGHVAGDMLLVALARRIEGCVRPGDTVARIGGDEFAMLLENTRSATEVLTVVERIHAELARPFQLDEHEAFTSASIGVTMSSAGVEEPGDLLRDAEAAMHRAKASEPGRHRIFDQEMRAGAMTQLRLETDLRRAVERQEFTLLYQPVVSLRPQRVIGFEGLIRWRHPERGLLAPADFLATAEETGLIGGISSWVVSESCRQAAEWATLAPGAEFTVAINLSPRLLVRPEVMDQLAADLATHGVPARRIKLEILESALMESPERARQVLKSLRAMGIAVALDDFGTGYSSLSYLHQYAIDELKIDRSFVAALTTRKSQATELVRSIVQLGRGLGLRVVAEGVETESQRRKLVALGCELAQGFLFAHPLPPPEAWQSFLAAQPAPAHHRIRRPPASS